MHILTGGKSKAYTAPEWMSDFSDAELLKIPVYEIRNVPWTWRYRARVYNSAKQDASETT